MNLYTTTEVLDIQHDICHCVAEVIGKTPLGSMEFSRIFTYQPDRSFIARRCGTKAYIKSIHIDSIHSDAAHELFDNFRKTAVNEFLFSSKVPRPMQHAIVAEFGYPVIAPELLPLLEMTRDLRYEGASYDEKSLSSDFIRWITSIEARRTARRSESCWQRWTPYPFPCSTARTASSTSPMAAYPFCLPMPSAS